MNVNEHPATLSRATSRASHRSRNSSLSRAQSLIKKNIELIDLRPADVLIERFVAWKVIVRQLTSYFEGIADIEKNVARDLTKLAGVIQVPFRAGNQFLGEGGLQDVYYDIRDKTRVIADQHADLGRTLDSSIVQHLQKLRAEIKAHIKNVQNDTGKLATSVARERELSTKLVGELANNISTFKNTPMNLHPKDDPYISNQAVARQLQRQVLEENLLQKSIVVMQQNSAHFEEGIVRSIQSAWQTYDEWQSRASAAGQEVLRSLNKHMSSLTPDREWIQFAARSDHLLDPDTPLRDPSVVKYPLKDDTSVFPVHIGHLERKKRFTRTYTESYYVLTPAGFLHEFPSSDPIASLHPTFSLFLPTCTLGPPSAPSARAHKFHIEGRKDGTGATKSKSGSLRGLIPLGHSSESTKAWSFRARSRDEMMEWWNDIRMLCARYLIASELVDRTGPVEAAVKSAGYNEEDYDELDTEPNEAVGHTVDEEQEWSGDEDHAVHHSNGALPDYSRPHSFAEKPVVSEKDSRRTIDKGLHYPSSVINHFGNGLYSDLRDYAALPLDHHVIQNGSADRTPTAVNPTSVLEYIGPDNNRRNKSNGRQGDTINRRLSRRPSEKTSMDEAIPVVDADTDVEETMSQSPPLDQSSNLSLTKHSLEVPEPPRTDQPSNQIESDDQEPIGNSDEHDENSDIYESEQEAAEGDVAEPTQEISVEVPHSSRSGIIGTVAASIGNVVRGATGHKLRPLP